MHMAERSKANLKAREVRWDRMAGSLARLAGDLPLPTRPRNARGAPNHQQFPGRLAASGGRRIFDPRAAAPRRSSYRPRF